jgi:hypothetical protein
MIYSSRRESHSLAGANQVAYGRFPARTCVSANEQVNNLLEGIDHRFFIEGNTMNQATVILNHLKKHKTIDAMESLMLFGSYRLSARILELREGGNEIKTEMIEIKTARGKPARVARYRLIKASKVSL